MQSEEINKHIPHYLTIEPLVGYCTANCIMCNVDTMEHKRQIMSLEEYTNILDKFMPIVDNLRFFTLVGRGEPLLDKNIAKKVKEASNRGFKGTAVVTNATELNEVMSNALIDAKLDSLLISLDSTDKEMHDKIRCGSDFDKICSNTKRFLEIRDKLNAKTRVLIRFTRQKMNLHQWPDFKEYWLKFLSPEKNDDVIMHNVHSLNYIKGTIAEEVPGSRVVCDTTPLECPYIFNGRMSVLCNGDVSLCCSVVEDEYIIGNVLYEDPLAIYNGPKLQYIRDRISSGKIWQTPPCSECTAIHSLQTRVTPRKFSV